MSTQPNLPIAATTKASTELAPLDALKPLLNDNGELELSSLQIGERVQKFIAFRDTCDFNLPLWDTAILSQFPPGTSLVPIPLIPGKQDAWRGQDAKKMQLKEGHVEPSADFLIKMGQIAGVQMDLVEEGLNPDTKLWSCRYNGRIQLPNGEWLVVENEGKDQEAFNNDGSKKAHVVESTRKKARRNVIKNLFGIPTSMLEADFDRAWVILKPVFHAGISAETDRIIAERKVLTDRATSQLFATTGAIDVKSEPVANKDGEITVAAMKVRIKEAKSLAELSEIKQALGSMSMTNEERKVLGALVIGKEDELGEPKL